MTKEWQGPTGLLVDIHETLNEDNPLIYISPGHDLCTSVVGRFLVPTPDQLPN